MAVGGRVIGLVSLYRGRSRFLELPGGFFNFFQQKFIFFPLNQFASCLLTWPINTAKQIEHTTANLDYILAGHKCQIVIVQDPQFVPIMSWIGYVAHRGIKHSLQIPNKLHILYDFSSLNFIILGLPLT